MNDLVLHIISLQKELVQTHSKLLSPSLTPAESTILNSHVILIKSLLDSCYDLCTTTSSRFRHSSSSLSLPPSKKSRTSPPSLSSHEYDTSLSSDVETSSDSEDEDSRPSKVLDTAPLPTILRNRNPLHRILSSTFPPANPRPYSDLCVKNISTDPLKVGDHLAFKIKSKDKIFSEGIVINLNENSISIVQTFPPPESGKDFQFVKQLVLDEELEIKSLGNVNLDGVNLVLNNS
ncbi:hypothetical protein RCL1_002307 [Eukaryota sp. TZLM3-RCL]